MFQDFGPSLCPYSPKCVEGVFCELRLYRILGSSSPLGMRSACSAISSNRVGIMKSRG